MAMRFIRKYFFLILAVLIAVFGYIHICMAGKEYTLIRDDFRSGSEITGINVSDDSTGKVEIADWSMTEKGLRIRLKSAAPGKVYVDISSANLQAVSVLYVHNNGVITNRVFFGDCTGSDTVVLCIVIYLALMIMTLIVRYYMLEKRSFYSYDNVLYLGLIIFSVFLTFTQVRALLLKDGIDGVLNQAVSSFNGFILATLPFVMIATVCVTVSNIKLIRKEGKTWRNMLGLILGLILGAGAVIPTIIDEFIYGSNMFDMHYERGIVRYIGMFLVNGISSVVAYLECILIGTIITGIKTAKHIPKLDKDFIIINGCQIRKDGTLTPLLKARVDRAVEFAKRQKDRVGRPIVFVPSGGKGSDEVISEAEAMKRYLIEQGISENCILPETASTTTEENFKYSYELIKKTHGSTFFNLAFSTTNYHVFRSGMLADKLGIRTEGIGSKTKRYYWVNAFVREYIATLAEKKKTHIKIISILLLITLISTMVVYVSQSVMF